MLVGKPATSGDGQLGEPRPVFADLRVPRKRRSARDHLASQRSDSPQAPRAGSHPPMWLNPAWSSAAAGCVRDDAASRPCTEGTRTPIPAEPLRSPHFVQVRDLHEVRTWTPGSASKTSHPRPPHGVFEVRWRVAGRDRSRSFMTRALADSYRSELVRAARRGLAFDPANGEPAAWAASEPVTATWYQHAVAYSEMKWPRLAPHSRASLADALATVTPLLTRETGRRPPDRITPACGRPEDGTLVMPAGRPGACTRGPWVAGSPRGVEGMPVQGGAQRPGGHLRRAGENRYGGNRGRDARRQPGRAGPAAIGTSLRPPWAGPACRSCRCSGSGRKTRSSRRADAGHGRCAQRAGLAGSPWLSLTRA